MNKDFSRRDFVKTIGLAAGAATASQLTECASGPAGPQTRNMGGFTAAPMERVRVGVIGLGMRGPGAVKRLSKLQDVEIVALCDIRPGGVTYEAIEARERNKRERLCRYIARPGAKKPRAGQEKICKASI